MQLEQLEALMGSIRGCTFASIDAVTTTKDLGLEKVVTNEVIILFTNKNSSGYENMVKRRLKEMGKDPACFTGGDLPWGERIPGTPLIKHAGRTYLQTILIKEGTVKTYLRGEMISAEYYAALKPKRRTGDYQCGLGDKAVIVRTYLLDNIKEIRFMNHKLTA